MQRQGAPIQHEVKPPAGSIARSRFYSIEPLVTETGYTVQTRRVGGEEIIWSCSVTFEDAAAFQSYQGNALNAMIEQAKSDLDNEYIK